MARKKREPVVIDVQPEELQRMPAKAPRKRAARPPKANMQRTVLQAQRNGRIMLDALEDDAFWLGLAVNVLRGR